MFKEAFTYNHAGNVLTRAYPDGTTGNTGEVVTYDHDTVSGLPLTLEGDATYSNDDYVTSTTWNPVGQVTAQQAGDGDGLYWDPAYDVHTRLERSLVRQGTSTGAISQDYNYDRDDNGMITRIWDDTVVNDQFQCFTYDDLGRLTTGFTGDWLCRWYRSNGPDPYYYAYEYDSIGNLTKKGGVTLDYSGVNAGPHAVTKYGTDDYSYDDNGNMTNRDIPSDTQTLTWDENHQLKSVADTSGTTSFLYDADGNRVKRTTGSESTVYVGGVYEYATAGANTTETSYYTLGGRTVAVRHDSDLYYLAQDHLGSTSLTRDESSGSVAVHRYSPFGDPRGTSAPTQTDHTYTGQIADAATDLMFYNARYYDPAIGRFISPDSIVPGAANPQNLNRYAYVRNNPTNYVDPGGHLPSERIRPLQAEYHEVLPVGVHKLEILRTLVIEAYRGYTAQGYRLRTQGTLSFAPFVEVLSFVPVIGDVVDGARAVAAMSQGDWASAAIYSAGVLPIPGVSGGSLRFGKEAAERLATREVLDHVDDLAASGRRVMGDSGITRAGQKLERHQGGLFPLVSGNVAAKNALGQEVLEDILTHPGSTVVDLTSGTFAGGFRVIDPLGRGATYDADNVFQYFGEYP